jgi:hypothetical protein
MNCPHFVADFEGVCSTCQSRIARALAILGRFAQCNHNTSVAAFGTGGWLRWCRDCGAIKAKDEGVWRAWELPLYSDEAFALDSEVMAAGVPRPVSEGDSERKNVIPIKPRG